MPSLVAPFLAIMIILIMIGPVAAGEASLSRISNLLGQRWPDNRTVNIVAHGHSVPAGYFITQTVRSFDAYPSLLHRRLSERFPFAVINVIVTAIGGENSEQGAARFADVLRHRPDVVLIDYGLNDRGIGLERARAAWLSMIRSARSANAEVIVLTPTPDLNAGPSDSLQQHADQIRTLARELDVLLIDSRAIFSQSGEETALMAQANHPNRRGHELIAGALAHLFQ